MSGSASAIPSAEGSSHSRGTEVRNPPLRGVRVLDLTQVVAGPFCASILADLGAEVVKLERAGSGDTTRAVVKSPGREEYEDCFDANNRNKKSIELNLKDPSQRQVGQELAKRADVVVENFAAGTVDRLGMGWKDLEPLNPRLVYCSLSGFGQTGPYRDYMAVDPIIQAFSGVMSVTGSPDGEPFMIGTPLADVISGMSAACAVLGALRVAERDGKGQNIDISMQASMIGAVAPRMGDTLQTGDSPERIGNQNPIRVPADAYRTKDGGRIMISVSFDHNWAPFCRALEKEEWIDDPRFTTMALRCDHREELTDLISARFAERTRAEWMLRLRAERVMAAPVNNYAQALADPQIEHRGLVRTVDHLTHGPIRVVGPAWLMPGIAAEVAPPPVLGQHTEEVLRSWLGWNDEKIAQWTSKA